MKTENLLESKCVSIPEVLDYARECGYEYIWAWQLDKIMLGRLSEHELMLEKLVEARIFKEGHEIHLFDFEDSWRAVEVTSDDRSIYQDEIQLLKNGGSITLRHYIDFDKDSSQAYICGTCLNGWEE